MANRITFIVEKKTGKMPNIVWQKVFEREISDYVVPFDFFSVVASLHHLFKGDDYRVVIIC